MRRLTYQNIGNWISFKKICISSKLWYVFCDIFAFLSCTTFFFAEYIIIHKAYVINKLSWLSHSPWFFPFSRAKLSNRSVWLLLPSSRWCWPRNSPVWSAVCHLVQRLSLQTCTTIEPCPEHRSRGLAGFSGRFTQWSKS